MITDVVPKLDACAPVIMGSVLSSLILGCFLSKGWRRQDHPNSQGSWEPQTWLKCVLNHPKVDDVVINACIVVQSCPALCDPTDCSPPGFSLHGILQARILEWIASLSSRGSSQPRDWTWVSYIAGRRFTLWATREAFSQKPYEMVILGMILLLRVSKTKYRFTNCALRQL